MRGRVDGEDHSSFAMLADLAVEPGRVVIGDGVDVIDDGDGSG